MSLQGKETARAIAYLKKYPQSKTDWDIDKTHDTEANREFMDLSTEEQIYVWRSEGIPEKVIELTFGN